jgi:hypothetical protein
MSATDIEKENLEAHVELCSERYKQIETRLGTIEDKVSSLHSAIQKSHLNTIKVLIGTAGTVIVGVLSLLSVIVSKMPH